MKRRTKLILLVAVLGCLGGIGVVLSKIAQGAGEPFLGAVVVLDDASWKAREDQDVRGNGYLWANTDTVFYKQKMEGKYWVIRRRIQPDRTVTAPETLPLVLREEEYIGSLSPNGTMLCIDKPLQDAAHSYRLVRTDGKGKSISFRSNDFHWCWSADSQSLCGTDDSTLPPQIERIDTQTGAVTTTILDAKENLDLETITPEGKLLGFEFDSLSQTGQKVVQWKVKEVKGKQVVTTTYQKRSNSPSPDPILSPNGKRILWYLYDEENSLLDEIQNKIFHKNIVPHAVIRWQVTDIDGKNERWIGEFPLDMQNGLKLLPNWTPNSKGIHFIHNGKLMYLAVP